MDSQPTFVFILHEIRNNAKICRRSNNSAPEETSRQKDTGGKSHKSVYDNLGILI